MLFLSTSVLRLLSVRPFRAELRLFALIVWVGIADCGYDHFFSSHRTRILWATVRLPFSTASVAICHNCDSIFANPHPDARLDRIEPILEKLWVEALIDGCKTQVSW
jgi:hypothetical protein